ncbi:type II toxin-antitoxin system HicB family antitoxin [Geminocystis sp. GBBB08]|uniref:type II toxin-antitoxin system HicB family antitoxin n=1 Tax=Geminocystis sp. GBBB08 TaxID=2604140 RepID=UPI0027E24801|nr:type II toxin-antitoxin system HicB family antitoxin [Geminocystis sp. GBBB08]
MNYLKDYTIVTRPDDNCLYVAYIPAILGCHSWEKTLEETESELVNVFEMI